MLPLLPLLACAPPPYDPLVLEGDGEPKVTITSPLPESSAYGCVIVTVDVQNLTLVDYNDPVHSLPVEGEGHYHILHAGGIARGTLPWTLVDYSADVTTPEAGTLEVILVDNDHQGIVDSAGKPVEHSIIFAYEPGVCAFTEDEGPGSAPDGEGA